MAEIKEAKISDLVFDDKNFNKHTEYGMSLIEKSIRNNGAGRSILIDKNNRIIAGNGVTEIAGQIGLDDVQIVETDGTKIIAVKRTDIDLDSKQGREMALADNATAAVDLEWDADAIADVSAEFDLDAGEWGVDIESDDRKGWGKANGGEAVCDLEPRLAVHERKEFSFLSTFSSSEEGIPLSAIKSQENVEMFANKAIMFITKVLGVKKGEDYCIITTPSRRHKDWNFANEVCKVVASKTGIEYIEKFCSAQDRRRIGGKPFKKNCDVKRNVILYDDILTTGSTIRKTLELLPKENVAVIVGINNN